MKVDRDRGNNEQWFDLTGRAVMTGSEEGLPRSAHWIIWERSIYVNGKFYKDTLSYCLPTHFFGNWVVGNLYQNKIREKYNQTKILINGIEGLKPRNEI